MARANGGLSDHVTKSLKHFDLRTDIDGRILLATTVEDPHTVDKLLTAYQTSLDPTEYYITTCLFAGFVVFHFKDGH